VSSRAVVLLVGITASCATTTAPPSSKPSSSSSSSSSSDDASATSAIAAASPLEQVIEDSGAPTISPPPLPHAAFAPRDVGPMKQGRADDGRWVAVQTNANAIAIADAGVAPEDSILWKTVLHPDPAHLAAELYVVAIDTSRVQLHSVAGAVDPEATVPAGKKATRPAIIPGERQAMLLAGFNGGWKSEHGHYGMKTDGVLIANPNDAACTVLAYDDDNNAIRIAPWKDVASTEPRMRFFRQTPACLTVGGVRHAGLSVEGTRNWGADQDGSPVIRRSAIGLNEKGTVLFVAVSNPISAPALANGMMHAGAHDVAELDVNWSFPKFLVFRPSMIKSSPPGTLDADSLFPTFVFDKGEYIRKRSPKDFFYLVRR
jgi:hypothetical protein